MTYDHRVFETAPGAAAPRIEPSERRDVPLAPAARSKTKRCMDVTIAAAVLIALLPVLLLVALLIRVDSPGPALFRQRRGGAGGVPFVVFKFRTMRVLEDGEEIRQATRGDSRITKVGAFLRRTSIDELPQLLNVLKGEMSLVGPRPHALAHDREFEALIPEYNRRFCVKPGVTGLAQVRGYRGETKDLERIQGRLGCDIEYIETWTIWRDVGLLFATLLVPLDRRAY